MSKTSSPKVAIVHDFLLYIGGAERNLFNFLQAFPAADLYFTFIIYNHDTKEYLKELRRRFPDATIHASAMQQWPFLPALYRIYKFFTPWVVEHLPLREHRTIIFQTSFLTKGYLAQPNQKVLVYVNTPFRWLWHLPTARISLINWLPNTFREWWSHQLRQWDWLASQRATTLIANSHAVQRRVERYYQRSSAVLWPAIDWSQAQVTRTKLKPKANQQFRRALGLPDSLPLVVMVDRLDLYKNHHRAIQAFSQHQALHEYHLVIIGDGPEYLNLRQLIIQTNGEVFVHQKDNIIITHAAHATILQGCTDEQRDRLRLESLAVLNLTEEDFGLGMAETLALGKPVVAYYRGGAADIVHPETTGVFLRQRTAPAISQALKLLRHLQENGHVTADHCRAQAKRFDQTLFVEQLRQLATHD